MNASAVGKSYSVVNRAYLAGLIDGDGCIMATIESSPESKYKFRVRIEVKITQKENVLLKKLARVFHIGRIAPNRTTTDWIIRNKKEVQFILESIQPYTHAKQKQVSYALQILKKEIVTKRDLLFVAQLADTLSTHNVRSKGRRTNSVAKIHEWFSSND